VQAVDDWPAYSAAPIGNGPFKIEGKWEHDQYIQVKRFDEYHAGPAIIDGTDFKIIDSPETAFTAFQAGELDFCQIPSGQIQACQDTYGVSPDGYTSNPGQQTLLGPESSVYYLVINVNDPVMSDKNVRLALNYAIDRQAICDSVFEGTREPATGIVPPGIAGYRDGAWPAAVYDIEKAKAALADAGFPGGEGFPQIKLSFNSGGGHEDIMAIVQQNFADIGITANFDTLEWAAYLDALAADAFQIGRLGWIADYPIMENFLFSLFYTDNGDNYCNYSNPVVDQKIMAARGIIDDDARIAAFQEVDDIIAADCPIIPMMFYKHVRVCSDRLQNFYFSPNMIADLPTTDLAV
jgi:peptide/nickel transport system substrate-binding protein/oligopeptide transport system substrate-binding protein